MDSPTVSPLLAILLVTSSSRGSTIAFQYPRRPKIEKRYSRVRYHVEEDDEKAKNQYNLQEDEMEDDFEGEVELSDDEDESSEDDDSDSDSEDLADVDEEQSDWEGMHERRDIEVASSSAGGTGTAATRDSAAVLNQRAKRLKAYQQYLGYETEILAAILSPKRELCHRKFELVIDDLAFIGHPVCVGNDGKWSEQQKDSIEVDDNPQETVSGYNIGNEDVQTSPTKPSQAPLTMFHVVLVLDRPDPSPYLPTLDLTTWLQIFYDNIGVKITSALLSEEARCEYISKESEKLIALRDRCMDDAQSYTSYLTQVLNFSSMARSLQQIFSTISTTSNAFVLVNESVEVHLQLPPILYDPARMLHMADIETPLDVKDAIYTRNESRDAGKNNDLLFADWTTTNGPMILPWKTLLLLNNENVADDDKAITAKEDVGNFGSTHHERDMSRSSQFRSQLHPKQDSMRSLADIADELRWSLEDDVYPMAQNLIYHRKARVVDVPRIQNFYAVSPLFDPKDLSRLSAFWSAQFPSLPNLASFLAKLSSSLMPFSVLCGKDDKALCLDALIWLLRNQIVVQMHVRLRLIADEAMKRRAAEIRKAERAKAEEEGLKRRVRDGMMKMTAGVEAVYTSSAPAAAIERGRGRENPKSPGSDRQEGANEDTIATVASVLSATKPDKKQDQGSQVKGSNTASVSQQLGLKKLADHLEELKFERRPVSRSRSPSRLAVLASEKASKSLRGRGSSGGNSRPSTPRGRGKGMGQSRDSSTSAPLLDTTQREDLQAHPQSVPALAINQATSQRQHRSVTRVDRSKEPTSRSPSRARMRVTGFGEGEEVHLESESGSVASSTELKSGLSQSLLKNAAEMEAYRRLSLVGEDIEAENIVATIDDEQDNGISGGTSEQTEKRPEPVEEETIEVEPWEMNPTASIIAEPGRASTSEKEWIAVIVEDKSTLLAQRLSELLPFLNGKHTIDEVVYRLNWKRKDLRAVLAAFKNEILTLVHP